MTPNQARRHIGCRVRLAQDVDGGILHACFWCQPHVALAAGWYVLVEVLSHDWRGCSFGWYLPQQWELRKDHDRFYDVVPLRHFIPGAGWYELGGEG